MSIQRNGKALLDFEQLFFLFASIRLYVLSVAGVILYWLLAESFSFIPVLWLSPGCCVSVGGILWLHRPRLDQLIFYIGAVAFLSLWILPIAIILIVGIAEEVFKFI